ncbi:hypothetical protein Hanom_Chr00s186213g01833241 [Helianthus anomalus]
MLKYARNRAKRVKILECQVLKHVGKAEEPLSGTPSPTEQVSGTWRESEVSK